MAVLINASNTRVCTILSNNHLNIVKFNMHVVSCFIFYVCVVFTPAPSDSGEEPLKAPQITKITVTILQLLGCPLGDSSLSKQCIEEIV
jgi:hypothetical protein